MNMEINVGDVLLVQDTVDRYCSEYLTQIVITYISDNIIRYTEVGAYAEEKDIIRYVKKDRFLNVLKL